MQQIYMQNVPMALKLSIDRLFKNHSDTKYVPEQSNFLVVRSITARWELEKETSQVSLSHISDDYFRSISSRPVDIFLVPEIFSEASPNEQSRGEPFIQEGFAILLVSVVAPNGTTGHFTYWLAIRPLDNGNFQREGMIRCHVDFGESNQEYKPPEESLTTIRLG
jgi:hypothetical protein